MQAEVSAIRVGGDGSAAEISNDLHRLLKAAHIPPPYVLVGHSSGGLAVRYYVSVHRSEVAGVVFVDASSEDARLEDQ